MVGCGLGTREELRGREGRDQSFAFAGPRGVAIRGSAFFYRRSRTYLHEADSAREVPVQNENYALPLLIIVDEGRQSLNPREQGQAADSASRPLTEDCGEVAPPAGALDVIDKLALPRDRQTKI